MFQTEAKKGMSSLALLIVITSVLIVSIVAGMLFWQTYARGTVPTLMAKQYESCKTIRSDFFLTNGRFWMTCNGRPYYAELGIFTGLSTEMNGWSFLRQQPDILNELKNGSCQFLSSNNSTLVFYCGIGTLKSYELNTDNFIMAKSGERTVSKQYAGCSQRSTQLAGNAVTSYLSCDGYDAVTRFYPNNTWYQLPVIVDDSLSETDRAYKSYNMSFNGCIIRGVQKTGLAYIFDTSCQGSNLTVVYNMEDNTSGISFRRSDFYVAFDVLKSKIFPPVFEGSPKFSWLSQNDEIYSWSGRALIAKSSGDQIIKLYLSGEGLD
jgi:hypothetical protein